MEAVLKRRLSSRAPPPTPIATGKGLRSAAVDDRVLTHYLESSVRIPDLVLPKPYPSKSPIHAPQTLPKINISSLLAGGDASGVETAAAVAAARELGAFAIDAGDLGAGEELRELIEERREFCWSPTEERLFIGGEELSELREEADRIFREKIVKVTSTLERVAQSITNILLEHAKIESLPAETHDFYSVLCLGKYGGFHQLCGDTTKHHNSFTLIFRITGGDHKFFIRSPDPKSCLLPAGSILVTVGKQFEEHCKGKLKSFDGEIFLEPSSDHLAPFSVELICSLAAVNDKATSNSLKIVSIMDQILLLLILNLLYCLWR